VTRDGSDVFKTFAVGAANLEFRAQPLTDQCDRRKAYDINDLQENLVSFVLVREK
jgi:hypothetical protein